MRRVFGPLLLATTCGIALVPASVLARQQDSGQACTEPYPPVFIQRGYPFNDPPPAVDAADVTVQRLAYDHPFSSQEDYNSDGVRDHDFQSNLRRPEATVRRPAGDITFARAGMFLDVVPAGNLDGKPGQEIWVFDFGGRDQSRPSSAAWVVPYDTPAGTHDPGDVGVRVPVGLPAPVTDLTGDGVDDLFEAEFLPTLGRLSGPTRLLSGADVMAVGVPGDARTDDPVATLPGVARRLADFGGSAPAILATAADPDFPNADLVRVIEGATTVAFTTRPSTFLFGQGGDVIGLSGPGGRFVYLAGGHRSGGITYWWSLDDPCTPLSTGSGGQAPPASPVEAAPRLTG